MNTRHIIVVDTETTGLNPIDGCEIVQLSAKAYDKSSLNPHHAGTFNIFLKPQRPEKAEPKALEVIGPIWEKALNEGVHPKVGLQSFVDWVKSINDTGKSTTKPMLAGHNIPFDMRFIDSAMAEYKIFKSSKDIPWHHNYLDTITVAFMFFESDPSMYSFTLDSWLSKFKNLSRATAHHDARDDVELTGEGLTRTLKYVRKLMKNRNI